MGCADVDGCRRSSDGPVEEVEGMFVGSDAFIRADVAGLCIGASDAR